MTAKRKPLSRKKTHASFESIIYWIGMTLVLTFLAWTIVMVLLQAFSHRSH